jgi:cyclohexyl-isocyanide hydratase
MRWLYHILPTPDAERFLRGEPKRLAPRQDEAFVHASFAPEVSASMNMYFADDAAVSVLRIAPHRLDVPWRADPTPRGPMPHIYGGIPRDAVVEVFDRSTLTSPLPDAVTGVRAAVVGYAGMTLLDFVGVWDPLARIARTGADAACRVDVCWLGPEDAWQDGALRVEMPRALDVSNYDVLVFPGGPGARACATREEVVRRLRTFPENRLVATVCTGVWFLEGMGRWQGRRVATHESARAAVAASGPEVVLERVVDDGNLVTAGGVTCAIDLGVYLVHRLYGDAVGREVARRMQVGSPS